jgi:hypothetical protein
VAAPTIPPEFLQSLSLGGRHSKLKLLEMLGHLESDLVKFVKGLSKIRNLVVHDVTQVGFALKGYLASLSTQNLDKLLSEVCSLFYYRNLFKSKGDREKQRAKI